MTSQLSAPSAGPRCSSAAGTGSVRHSDLLGRGDRQDGDHEQFERLSCGADPVPVQARQAAPRPRADQHRRIGHCAWLSGNAVPARLVRAARLRRSGVCWSWCVGSGRRPQVLPIPGLPPTSNRRRPAINLRLCRARTIRSTSGWHGCSTCCSNASASRSAAVTRCLGGWPSELLSRADR